MSAGKGLSKPESRVVIPVLYGLSFALIVLGLKLYIIAGFGSSVPFWDQWDAEADRLYRPFLEGSLRFADLFLAHNEHRIFTTRVLGLSLLALNNGVWDPMLEMYVNALIHVGTLLLLLFLMQKGLSGSRTLSFFAFATILFAVPLGHENTLAGFQSQFYFLMLFSFLLLWTAHRFESAPAKWIWFVMLAAFLSFCSMASGALSIAAAAGLLMVRRLAGVERKPSSLLLTAVLACAFIAAVAATPALPGHATLKAKDLQEFTLAVLIATGGGILYLPLAVFMFRVLIRRSPAQDHSWFVFSLGLWIFGQICALAYGRGNAIIASRYLDLFAVGFLLNFYCLTIQLQEGSSSSLAWKGIAVWTFLVMTGLGVFAPETVKQINDKRVVTLRHQDNVNGYLMTGNAAFLQKAPYSEIPYPDAARLQLLLDKPAIAGILTPEVNGHNTNRGMRLYTGKSRKKLMLAGSLMFFSGLGLLLHGNLRNGKAGHEKET
jgi:hypothetical protein